MFFIFVLSHPQRNGDFFRYRCKTDVGVPDVNRTLDHVQQRVGVSFCVYLLTTEKKPFHRCFQLTSTRALADKGYWVDTNGDWHRNARGSNCGEEEKNMPQEKEQRQRQDKIVCNMCNMVRCAFFRPTVFLHVYTLLYTLYVYEGDGIPSFINNSVFLIPVFRGPDKSGDMMYMKSQVQNCRPNPGSWKLHYLHRRSFSRAIPSLPYIHHHYSGENRKQLRMVTEEQSLLSCSTLQSLGKGGYGILLFKEKIKHVEMTKIVI